MIENTQVLTVGTRVEVDFISESRTAFSGKRFTGNGVLEIVDEHKVMGRLDNGLPFMCDHGDVKPINDPFALGCYVFLKDKHYTEMFVVTNILQDQRIELKTAVHGYPVPERFWGLYYGKADGLRPATAEEKEALLKVQSKYQK